MNNTNGTASDKDYYEWTLPSFLKESIEEMQKSWEIEDSGRRDMHWDIYWCNLNADINSAEVERLITSEQAWYLRDKYLRMVCE